MAPQSESTRTAPISSLDLAWLAGIIDGEGSLEIETRQWNKALKPRVRVSNNSMEMIQKVSQIYHALGLRFYYQLVRGLDYHLAIVVGTFGSCRKLLQAIEPYTVAKKRQVRLLLDYIAEHDAMYKEGRYALRERLDEWKAIEQDYKARLSKLRNEKVNAQRLSRAASRPLRLDEGIVQDWTPNVSSAAKRAGSPASVS